MKQSIIAKLKKEGVLKVYHDYRAGHADDLSGNNNTGTLSSTLNFSGNGLEFDKLTADRVSIADNASIRQAQGTFIWLGNFIRKTASTNERLLARVDGATARQDIYFPTSFTNLRFSDGTTTSIITYTFPQCRCIAVDFSNGATPNLYTNGIFRATGSLALAFSANNGGINVCNYATGTNAPHDCHLEAFLFVSRVLTATEQSQLYAELENTKWPTKPYANTSKPNDNLLADGNMEASGTTAWTPAGAGAVLSKQTGTPYNGKQCLRVASGGANAAATQAILVVGNKYRVQGKFRSDGTRTATIYVGLAAAASTTSATWQSFDAEITCTTVNVLGLYNIGTTGYSEFDDVVVTEVGKPRTNFQTSYGVPVSTASRGGAIGQFLENTPFQFGDATGRFTVTSETVMGRPNTKVITCGTAGRLYIDTQKFQQTPTGAAFGTFDLYLYMPAGGSTTVVFIADTIGDRDATGQDGYYVRYTGTTGSVAMGESVNGTPANKFTATGAFSVAWNKFTYIRDALGVFTHKINGVVTTAATGANPTTADLTKTTSEYLVLNLVAGDKVALGSTCGCIGLTKKIL